MRRLVLLALIIATIAVAARADQTIDQLGAAGALSATDGIPIYQGANPIKRVPMSAIAAYIQAPSVAIPCSSAAGTIDTAISNNPAGTTFQLAAGCTYTGQFFHTKNNITIKGAGATSTILDGGFGAGGPTTNDNKMTCGGPTAFGCDGTVGVTIQDVTIQHYNADWPIAGTAGCGAANTAGHSCNGQFLMWTGWVLKNSIVQLGGGWGLFLDSSGSIINSLITNNRHGGIAGDMSLVGTDVINRALIMGSEISNNNTRHDDQGDDAGAIKILQKGTGIRVLNNYVHDNSSGGIWCDGQGQNWDIQGNTVINNATSGIFFETCEGADISKNVVNNNGQGPFFGGSPGTQIFLGSARNVNVHNNNVLSPAGNPAYFAIYMDVVNRSDAQPEQNNTLLNNVVTFAGTTGGYGYRNGCSGTPPTGSGPSCSIPTNPTGWISNGNTFYMASSVSTDTHFMWGQGLGDNSQMTFAAYRTASGQDAGSTATVGNGSLTGCLAIGCTGSGIP